ncbi:MAG: methyltransferase [Clostridiales bacterium]|nr:methyltransferase [Clostridiales bacterium]
MYKAVFNDKEITVETKVSLFSPNEADRGTLSMLRHVEFTPDMKVMDLGCGTGIVSLAACCFGVDPHNIVMTDIDPVASSVSLENMKRNGFDGAVVVTGDGLTNVPGSGFDLILSNPPYHTDFKVAKTFIEKGFNRLKIGGKMYMVTKRKDWYKNKLISIFGGVKIFEDDGYFVFEAQKRNENYAPKKRRKV